MVDLAGLAGFEQGAPRRSLAWKTCQMQFLMVESYLRYIYCHGVKNPLYLFENLRLVTLDSGERPIAYCSV